jgi:urease accessory protein
MTRRAKVFGHSATVAVASALLSQPAEAHLVETGLGPVYDGVAHLALSPECYVPIVGAALLAGLRGKDHARLAILVLPLAWFVGGLLGGLPGAPDLVAPPWLPFLAVGGLVAADLKLPVGATAALLAALGLILGYPNGLAMAAHGQGLRGVLGSTAALFVLVTLVAALASATTIAWVRIAWRVAGSWIAASGLLLLGWALKAR